MQTTFLNTAGVVLFTRDDMEQGNWTQEEYTVNATFPYVAGKVIERGQRLSFNDPATGSVEVFEVRNVTNIETEHYQQVIAEHIAVSELSDEHINTKEITDQTPAQALTTVLAGTLWAVGNVEVVRTSSVDISRGSVWQAVGAIAQNWNVYIVPRVTVNAAGDITGRFLDVTESSGVWRGLRLSLHKNMSDSSVVYDDSETLTALYGYGGNIDVPHATGDDTTEELTFAGVTWAATADHPAKPAGQTYLEDPQATALYGRNGRPRFGYYQNGDITDAELLLQKTWEALKQTNKPKISITGTVTDLYRFGYKDQPIRLHDLAIVDIEETGASFYLQIIRCDVDLIDATATRPEIGDYIANIIYINRETYDASTGSGGRSGGGGGGGRGHNNSDYEKHKTYTALEKDHERIAMVVGTRNGDDYIQAGEIALAINESGESTAHINANRVNISATDDIHMLSQDVEYDEQGRLVLSGAAGVYIKKTKDGRVAHFGIFDDDNLTAGVIATKVNGVPSTYIKGDKIYIGDTSGIPDRYRDKTLDGTVTQIGTDFVTVNTLLANKIEASDITSDFLQSRITAVNNISANSITAGSITVLTGGSSSSVASQAYVNGCIYGTISATASGGQITLRGNRLGTSGAVNLVTFNIADTQFYQDGVSAAAAEEAAKYHVVQAYRNTGAGSDYLRGSALTPTWSGALYYSDRTLAGNGKWFLRKTTENAYPGNGTRLEAVELYERA